MEVPPFWMPMRWEGILLASFALRECTASRRASPQGWVMLNLNYVGESCVQSFDPYLLVVALMRTVAT